jgi:hypothetical protein
VIDRLNEIGKRYGNGNGRGEKPMVMIISKQSSPAQIMMDQKQL